MKIQELKKEIKKQDKELKRKKMKSSLSFLSNEEDELEGGDALEILPLKKKIAKNPDVDTSHLPDRERDEILRQEKERLTQEWLAEQEIIKNQVSSPLPPPSPLSSSYRLVPFLPPSRRNVTLTLSEDGGGGVQLLGRDRASESN
jgi:hypothetical protein